MPGGHVSRTLTVISTLVPPDRLLHGCRVNVRRSGDDHFEIQAAEDSVDSSVLSEIQTRVQKAINELPEILIPGTIPRVTSHLADMNALVDAEISPHLISIYLRRDTMPQDLADEFAGAIAYIVGRIT